MKKLFLLFTCCLIITGLFAQTRQCTPQSTLNFSTGQNGSGGIIGDNVTDPFWGGTSVANMTGIFAPWNNISGVKILTSGLGMGTRTFKRCFYLCAQATVNFKGVFRDDNMVNSFVLKNSGGTAVWTFNTSPYNGTNPQCWKDIPYSGTVTLAAGQYCFEFTYTNEGGLGGFALMGNLSTSSPVLSNSRECCCNCDNLPRQFSISGPTCFCWSRGCNSVLTYSAPRYDNASCFKYEWRIGATTIPITGQGTENISFNCKDLKPGTYTITLTISCSDRKVSSSITLVICEKPTPTFTMVSGGADVTLTPTFTGGQHYWFLVKDDNNDCMYGGNEQFEFNPNTVANFPVVHNQQYTVYHFVYNDCGNGCGCLSYQIMCFKWFSPQMLKAAPGARNFNSISDRSADDINSIPQQFRKQLPAQIFQKRADVEKSIQQQ